MPNLRRRRFSTQQKIANQQINKSQNETQTNKRTNLNLSQSRINPNTSKNTSAFEIIPECNITKTTLVNSTITSNKEVTASSSNINLYSILNNQKSPLAAPEPEYQTDRFYRGRTLFHDNYLHRVKVRSPKRKVSHITKQIKKRSVGITVSLNNINGNSENDETKLEIIKQVKNVAENTDQEEEICNYSTGYMCRICHSRNAMSDAGNLISPCSCRGTIERVHVKCLEKWLTESGKSRCELCGEKYAIRRIHRFGLLKAFFLWLFTHNAKNMIVDFLGIMIMTPIAVVGAGLTERTFTRLMMHDHETPWPVASTFVLACMTLVCYYCWFVSALTRHALGWWIWYRSHYEVRLQLEEE